MPISNASTAAASNTAYLVYTALLTQSGTSAPTATVLQNTLGGSIVWTRFSAGNYRGTLANAFPNAEKFVGNSGIINAAGGSELYGFVVTRIASSIVVVQTGEYINGGGLDDCLNQTFIEIRVYS
jgi:hypothetical protein